MQPNPQPVSTSRCSAISHSDGYNHEFYEGVLLSSDEVSYTIRPYPVGPTALISLGLVIVMLWTFFYVLTTSGATSQRYTARRYAGPNSGNIPQARWTNNAEIRQQITQQEYDSSGWGQDLRPAPNQEVYVRGKLSQYHWQKSCPVLSPRPYTYQTHKPTVTLIRCRAEALRYIPCYYCSEIERKNRPKNRASAVNNADDQTLSIF